MKKLHPLRLERLKRGWSQYHVHFLSGVPQSLISYAERGYPALSLKQKKKIAAAFDVPEEKLFDPLANESGLHKQTLAMKEGSHV